MKTMSGSVSTSLPHCQQFLMNLTLYSHTTLHQKYSSRTTTQRLIYGLWESSSTSCSQAKFHSQVIQNLRLSVMWSKEIFISIMSLSKDTQKRLRSSSCVWLRRMWHRDIRQSRPWITHGSRTVSCIVTKQWAQNRQMIWRTQYHKWDARRQFFSIWVTQYKKTIYSDCQNQWKQQTKQTVVILILKHSRNASCSPIWAS